MFLLSAIPVIIFTLIVCGNVQSIIVCISDDQCLSIAAPPDPIVTITNSSYMYSINTKYVLTCHAMDIDNLVVPINLTWTKINGVDVEVLTATTGNVSTLVFSSLSLSDSAAYVCTANISFPLKNISNYGLAFTDISLIRKCIRSGRNCEVMFVFAAPDVVTFAGRSVISESAVCIQWRPPVYPNGVIKSYSVEFLQLDDYETFENKTFFLLNSSTLMFNITGLSKLQIVPISPAVDDLFTA